MKESMTITTATTLLTTLPPRLTSYLDLLTATRKVDALGVPFYTVRFTTISVKPSTIIHPDATTSPSTHHKFQVYLEAACGYQTLHHYVDVDALGRLHGALRHEGSES